MSNIRWITRVTLLLVATGCTLAQRPSALEQNYRSQIEPLLPGMAAEKIPDRQGPQQTLEKLCHQAAAPGKEEDRVALSNAIMALVGRETAKPARVWMLRKIETLGGEEAVAGLAKQMHDSDPEIADLARRALANNPSDKALAALRAELAAAKQPEWQAAIINALAWRHDQKSVDALAKIYNDKQYSAAGRAAVLSALGGMQGEAAAKAAHELMSAGTDLASASNEVVDTMLRSAEHLAQHGKTAEAKTVYVALLDGKVPEHCRIAALTGLACLLGEDAGSLLLKYATGDDNHMRIIAARCLALVPPSKQINRQIAEAMKKASPAARVLLVEALGDRGDGEALTYVVGYMMDPDQDVRLAAYAAMGKLGTAPTANVLLTQATTSSGDQLEVIRASLAMLKGPGVDDEILKKLKAATGALRIEAIMAVWGRRIAAAKPTLLELANDSDEKVRLAVLTAMERLGNEADLPALAEQLAEEKGNACNQAAEKAITSVCRRAGDAQKCVAPLVAAMPKASPGGQAAIIKALAKIQGEAALAAVRDAGKSENATVQAAVRAALKEWPPVYITSWQVCGPFKQEGKGASDLFDIPFPPETEGAAAEWKPLKPNDSGRFDLNQVTRGENCCSYVKTTIYSKSKQKVVLCLGSDDGAKVWLNGKVVHEKNVTRALKCTEDEVKVELNEGANPLLLKITQAQAGFEFCCAVRAAEGGPAEGVRCQAK